MFAGFPGGSIDGASLLPGLLYSMKSGILDRPFELSIEDEYIIIELIMDFQRYVLNQWARVLRRRNS